MTAWTTRAVRKGAGTLAAAVLLAMAAAPAATASTAASASAVAASPSPSFTIVPTPPPGTTRPPGYLSQVVSPRHAYRESFSVINYAATATRFWLYAADAYTIKDGGGFAVEGMSATPRDVGAWISPLPKVITVPARKQLNISFTITVPASAAPGEHAGGIVVEDMTPQLIRVSGQLQVRRYIQVFTRLYLTVPGRLSPDFALSGLEVAHPQPPFPVVTQRSGMIAYGVTNTGDVIISPTAELTATGLFGSTIMTKALPATGQVLPGGVADYSIPWRQLPAIGPVHVYLTVRSAYGISRVAVYSYTAIPVPFVAAVIVLLLVGAACALTLLVLRRHRARRQQVKSAVHPLANTSKAPSTTLLRAQMRHRPAAVLVVGSQTNTDRSPESGPAQRAAIQ